MANNIKDYREKELRSFNALNIIIFYICHAKMFEGIGIPILPDFIQNIFLAVIIPIVSTIIENILTQKQKDNLFLFRRAGETVFTRIKNGDIHDIRFDIKEATITYDQTITQINNIKSISERRKIENSKWYEIYKNHEEEGAVENTQRAYLLCRDIYITSFLALFFIYPSIFILCQIFTCQIIISYRFILYLLSCTIFSSKMTYNTMNKFVNTVIARDIAEKTHAKKFYMDTKPKT